MILNQRHSLFFQLSVVLTLAILAAGAITAAVRGYERYRADLIEASGPALTRFIDIAAELQSSPSTPLRRMLMRPRGPAQFQMSSESLLDRRGGRFDGRLTRRVEAALAEGGLVLADVRAGVRERAPRRVRDDDTARPVRGAREIIISARLADGRWLNARLPQPPPRRDDYLAVTLFMLLAYAFVLGASLFFARRVARPLQTLADAAARVGATDDPAPLQVEGPSDVQRALTAFNAMSTRVSQLLKEKDVMLGAIGHDLRTPLASLRLRLEAMEPESERRKAIRTVEEASALLEDILSLARKGRSCEVARAIDLSVVVEDLVEDYTDAGRPVVVVGKARAPALVRPALLSRALRNIIDNALAYGHVARIRVLNEEGCATVSIEDDGPGMTMEDAEEALRPFTRGEASRNRKTGGSGLGLALADAIIRTHDGSISFGSAAGGGLRVVVRLPSASDPHPHD